MGILNVTPDSFSDGGRFAADGDAVRAAERMVEEGADIIDVGGESTRPGAPEVSAEEEIRRVVPVVEALAPRLPIPVSIDTAKAAVARAAIAAGAAIVNDVTALTGDPAMGDVAARAGVPVVLMHMRGTPRTMQADPENLAYGDVVADVRAELSDRLARAERAGIDPALTIVDPGIGFAKTPEHNLALLARLNELAALGRPILVGPSRKSFIGHVLGLPVMDRLEGTAAAVAIAVMNGAHIVRVHDVGSMVRVVRMAAAIRGAGG
ncbi:MAG: dihydropteroate synthase [Nitrospirae bacterium]|nr:dihydropteroate synthase [Nitrospirota bacterium]